MGGRKKENLERGRIEFLTNPELTRRLLVAAERRGLNLSGLIRMVLLQWLADNEPEEKGRGKKS